MSQPHPLPVPKKSIPIKKDPTGRLHFVYPQSLGSAAQRFETFQTWTAHQGFQLLEPASLVLCCLVAFDGLSAESEIQAVYGACAMAVSWNSAVRVDWTDGQRFNARNLSCFTILAVQRVRKWDSFSTALEKLEEKLKPGLITCQANNKDTTWEILKRDCMAWLQHVLPPIFYGHVSGVALMSALPSSVLAREQERLALVVDKTDLPEIEAASSNAYVYALEAAMLGKPASARDAGAFIKKLLTALKPPAKGSIAHRRKTVVDALNLLSVQLDHVDEVCALLYLFALHLAVSGTRRKSVLAPDTPHSYVQGFVLDFHTEMDGLCLGNISPEKYEQVFKALLDPTQTLASYRVAGLKAFHLFLRTWWSVPDLPGEVFKVDASTPVATNVIWAHEYTTINRWFAETESTRFTRQLHTALVITRSVMIRIEELMKLRLLNLIDEGTQLCLEVAREIRDGKEKTRSGRRRVYVTDPAAMELIRAWYAQRVQENATPDSYLFGDPSNPGKIADRGKMYYWMNRLLQIVAGDETVSVHTCRHSVASLRFAEIVMDSTDHEVNPMDLLATEAGHVGAHITAAHYCHLFEQGLRFSLDNGMYCLDLDYRTVAVWTKATEATLRKRVSRLEASSEPKTVFWEALKRASTEATTPKVSVNYQLTAPVNPLLSWRVKPLSFAQVTGILSDIAAGLSTDQACLRQDVDKSIVDSAMKAVGAFADIHGSPELGMLDRLALGIHALKDGPGKLLGMLPDFSRMAQPRWKLLSQAIQKIDKPVLSEAVDYWQRALSGRHLAVRPGPGLEKILELINTALISTDLIEIRWCDMSAQVAGALARAQVSARSIFGGSIKEREVEHRAGRPALWLVIGSAPKSLDVDGSANSMSGFHCALLSAHVWLAVQTTLENK